MMKGGRSALRWLHLTDLHVGKKDQAQILALHSLIEAVEKYSDQKPFDVVFLTGDLAFSGASAEYETLEKELIAPLRASPLTQNAKFIAVPGNHDLDCSVEFPPSWKDLGSARQAKFFYSGEDGRKVRGSRATAFAEYSAFTRRNQIASVDPTREPATLIEVALPDRTFAIVSTVTAFFSDKEVDDKQKAPAPNQAILSALDGRASDAEVIVLGHHSGPASLL
jgi:3',5'-cyclic AMP phosphodiesterase CpdA